MTGPGRTATKTMRRKLAYEARNQLSLYLDMMKPHMEQYCAGKSIDPASVRLHRLQLAEAALAELRAAEEAS